jgi:hypothetical protein
MRENSMTDGPQGARGIVATPDGLPCPRCGQPFRCGIGDAGPCACTGITLDAATLNRLRERYQGCLCLDCLRLEAGPTAGPPGRA